MDNSCVDFYDNDRLKNILMLQRQPVPENEFMVLIFRGLSKAVLKYCGLNKFLSAIVPALIGMLLGHVDMFSGKILCVSLLFLLLSVCSGVVYRYVSEFRRIGIEGDLLSSVKALMAHHDGSWDGDKALASFTNRSPWYFYFINRHVKKSKDMLPYEEVSARVSIMQTIFLSFQIVFFVLSVAPFCFISFDDGSSEQIAFYNRQSVRIVYEFEFRWLRTQK